ncbi:hypothetical protein L208DRAFT_1387579 [Tricholoma matsutake]|nr:hypothetical protein L208DRAFT_1387579 [Tricholoma matsutake 945]
MPRKKPPVPVQMHYSMDLKWCVIHQAYTLHKHSKDIATDLNMLLRVVQCVEKTWQEYMGRTPLLSMGETQFMLALLEHTPGKSPQEPLQRRTISDIVLVTVSAKLLLAIFCRWCCCDGNW